MRGPQGRAAGEGEERHAGTDTRVWRGRSDGSGGSIKGREGWLFRGVTCFSSLPPRYPLPPPIGGFLTLLWGRVVFSLSAGIPPFSGGNTGRKSASFPGILPPPDPLSVFLSRLSEVSGDSVRLRPRARLPSALKDLKLHLVQNGSTGLKIVEYKIVVVGLDNAGKTTTLYKLHLGEVVVTHPTVGSNVEELVYKNIRFEVWDLGGQDRLRTSWATYYRGTHAVIVVIDSTDRARISIMKEELLRLLQHDDLEHAVVLVFANKQDLKDAMTPAEITDALSLHSIKNHDWHIQASCAVTGEGLYDGMGWIAQRVSGKATS
ncbi:ADP-ribosylation factor-like protein 5 [Nymphaea thermarum]|nr:ADP-ribosylation factor-like protein 5 [Nymphaea thermarum]